MGTERLMEFNQKIDLAEREAETGRPGKRRKAERSATGDRRDNILEAATRRFAEFGFEATTVRQIADDVELLSGSLYHHFATKEEMLDEIVRDAVLFLREQAVRIAGLPIDAEQRLVALIRAEIAALTSNQEVYAIIFNERKFFRRSEYFTYLMMARKEAYDAWCSILEDGKRTGLFDPELDVFLTISTIVRMLNSGADWFRNEHGSPLDSMAAYPLDRLLDFYLGFILRAIRIPGRAGDPIPSPAPGD
jgi:AcrR family transcriptional regulator